MQIEMQRSEEITPSHGGARPGAGRLPGGKNRRGPADAEILKVLTTVEERRQWRELLMAADTPKLKLEVLTRISELRRGKPYVATNPHAQRRSGDDNRLMIAIQNLIPGTAPAGETRTAKKRGRQRKLKDKTK